MSWQGWARRSATVLAQVIATYALMELVTIFVVHRSEPDEHRSRRVFWSAMEHDDQLGYRLKANQHVVLPWADATTVFDTDAHGFRNLGRDYDRARVFFIGDSFVYGMGVAREESFVGRIESTLGEPVIALAAPGYGFTQYEALARAVVEQHRPKVVALAIYTNDLERPLPAAAIEAQRAEGLATFSTYSLADRTFAQTLRTARAARNRAPVAFTDRGTLLSTQLPRSNGYFTDGESSAVEAGLGRILDGLSRAGISTVVFLLPSKESALRNDFLRLFPARADSLKVEDEAYRRLADIARAHGATAIDLTDVFRRQGDNWMYFHVDGHWTPEGHRLATRLMTVPIAAALRNSVEQ